MSRRARDRAGHHKARQPRPVHLNIIQRAITGASKLPAVDVARVKASMHNALETFGRGHQCALHWASMADALNVAEQLAQRGICSDDASHDRIQAGQQALAAVHQRHAAGGSWTLYAAERTALDDALWLHGVQLDHCSFTEYEGAITDVQNRVRQALAGNAPRGCMVLQGELGAAL